MQVETLNNYCKIEEICEECTKLLQAKTRQLSMKNGTRKERASVVLRG